MKMADDEREPLVTVASPHAPNLQAEGTAHRLRQPGILKSAVEVSFQDPIRRPRAVASTAELRIDDFPPERTVQALDIGQKTLFRGEHTGGLSVSLSFIPIG